MCAISKVRSSSPSVFVGLMRIWMNIGLHYSVKETQVILTAWCKLHMDVKVADCCAGAMSITLPSQQSPPNRWGFPRFPVESSIFIWCRKSFSTSKRKVLVPAISVRQSGPLSHAVLWSCRPSCGKVSERCRYNHFSARQLIQCLPGYILGVLKVLALTTISLLDIIKIFSNLELNRCKKYRDTSVQLTTTSTCPCTTTTLSFRSKSQFAMTLMMSIYNYGVTIQSCSGTWVWLIIIHVHSCRYASCRETLIRRR